ARSPKRSGMTTTTRCPSKTPSVSLPGSPREWTCRSRPMSRRATGSRLVSSSNISYGRARLASISKTPSPTGPGPSSHPPRQLKREALANSVDLVVNARVDVFRTAEVNPQSVEEALRRARLYIEAGADCIFPIRLGDEKVIAELVAALPVPINILLRPDTPSISRLIELGVTRISLGGGLFRTAYAAARDALTDLRNQVSGAS